MSFDHWLIRDFRRMRRHSGRPDRLGRQAITSSRRISPCWRTTSPSFPTASADLPNRFVSFVRERLGMPVITWTVRDEPAVEHTFAHADQMTFEGFDPDLTPVA